MSTTIKKYKIQQLQANNDMLELHPETDADVVNYSKTISGTAVTTVKGALDKIVDGIGVTGVKGNAEQNYRTGQVNITPADIGAEPTLTFDDTPTANSNNPVKSKGIKSYVDSAKQAAIAVAEGKTKNIVIDYTATGTDVINTSFNSSVQELRIDYNKYIKPLSGDNILLFDLKVGDIISITQTNVPDRWVAGFSGGEVSLFPLEIKLDIDTTVTQNSTNPVSSGAVYTAMLTKQGVIDSNNRINADYVNDSAASTNKFWKLANSKLKIRNGFTQNRESEITVDSSKITLETHQTSLGTGWMEIIPDRIKLTLLDTSDETAAELVLLSTGLSVNGKSVPLKTVSSVTAGTYSALTINSDGLATAGGQIVEVGATSQTTPSASLAVGGIFFKEI